MVQSGAVRVLVLWADPEAENLGLQALAAGAVEVATAVWGHCTFTFHSHNTKDTPLTKRKVLADIGRPRGPIKDYFRQFDVILDTGGGDSFTDIYGLRRLLLMRCVVNAARRAESTLVMTPQTIGPFKTTLGRTVARNTLRRVDVVCARDSISVECARSLGRDVDILSTDMAFALPELDRAKSHDVVINVSGLLWNPNPHVDCEQYKTNILSLIRIMLESGRDVSLLAHVLNSPLTDNDVPAVREAAAASGQGVRTVIPANLQEARSILASSNVLVGSRMHAAINALAVGTVAIPWAYSRKFTPLMTALGWDCTVDLKSADDAVAATVAMLDPANLIKLQSSVASVRERADRSIERLTRSRVLVDLRSAPFADRKEQHGEA